MFNIWQGRIQDCCLLDLCAGNGSIGAEALCRGAFQVVGIEQSGRACGIIKYNWGQFAQPQQQFQVLRGDVVQGLKKLQGQQFDYIYFDPPYEGDLYQPVIDAIARLQLLHETGELAVEHNPKFWQAISLPSLEIYRQKVYGETALTFYRPV